MKKRQMSCEQALNMLGPSGYRDPASRPERYVDFEVLLSWVREQQRKCMAGDSATHLSMMFGEIEAYLLESRRISDYKD